MMLLSQVRIEDGPVAIQYVQQRDLERRRQMLQAHNGIPLVFTVLDRASRMTVADVQAHLRDYRSHSDWYAWDPPVEDFVTWARAEPHAERWEVLKFLAGNEPW